MPQTGKATESQAAMRSWGGEVEDGRGQGPHSDGRSLGRTKNRRQGVVLCLGRQYRAYLDQAHAVGFL
jgi:hypothetical protein